MISVGLRVAPVNVDQVTTGFKLQDATLLTTICNTPRRLPRQNPLHDYLQYMAMVQILAKRARDGLPQPMYDLPCENRAMDAGI